MVVHDEVIFRIPIRPRLSQRRSNGSSTRAPNASRPSVIAGAMLSGPSSIDFVLRDRQRVRAVMDSDCPALDFYGGFYLQPDDDMICAKRETIRSRVGGSCRIEQFRWLVPQYKQVQALTPPKP